MVQTSDIQQKIEEFLKTHLGDGLLKTVDFRGDRSYFVEPSLLFDLCRALQENDSIDVKCLMDITSVDWFDDKEADDGRFEVIYNFYSISNCYRFFIKVKLPEDDPKVASLTPVFASANWMEREVYDLMGIEFEGHPELTKILTADELEGFPLRRDFPLTYEVPQFSFNKDDPPEVIR